MYKPMEMIFTINRTEWSDGRDLGGEQGTSYYL